MLKNPLIETVHDCNAELFLSVTWNSQSKLNLIWLMSVVIFIINIPLHITTWLLVNCLLSECQGWYALMRKYLSQKSSQPGLQIQTHLQLLSEVSFPSTTFTIYSSLIVWHRTVEPSPVINLLGRIRSFCLLVLLFHIYLTHLCRSSDFWSFYGNS